MVSSIPSQQARFGDLSYTTAKNKYPIKYNEKGFKRPDNLLQINIMATGNDVKRFAPILNVQEASRGFKGEKFKIGNAVLVFDLKQGLIEFSKGTGYIKEISANMIELYQTMLKELGSDHIIGIQDEDTLKQCQDILSKVETSKVNIFRENSTRIEHPLKIKISA